MKKKIPKDDINSLIAILPKYHQMWGAGCRKTERDNISMILKRQQHIYMA